mmetsp:Transcript_10492/g.23093  ORF Transcript_10492/g.23093 Transcript_10492/m.23093 type:complete len:219 (-) Transcript_10492:171-827(-)
MTSTAKPAPKLLLTSWRKAAAAAAAEAPAPALLHGLGQWHRAIFQHWSWRKESTRDMPPHADWKRAIAFTLCSATTRKTRFLGPSGSQDTRAAVSSLKSRSLSCWQSVHPHLHAPELSLAAIGDSSEVKIMMCECVCVQFLWNCSSVFFLKRVMMALSGNSIANWLTARHLPDLCTCVECLYELGHCFQEGMCIKAHPHSSLNDLAWSVGYTHSAVAP